VAIFFEIEVCATHCQHMFYLLPAFYHQPDIFTYAPLGNILIAAMDIAEGAWTTLIRNVP
jgi:hypothetical protein